MTETPIDRPIQENDTVTNSLAESAPSNERTLTTEARNLEENPDKIAEASDEPRTGSTNQIGTSESKENFAQDVQVPDQDVQVSAQAESGVTVDDDNNEERDVLKKSKNLDNDDKNEDRDDDEDSIIDIVSESEVNEAAKQLLSAKSPQIRVNYRDETFLLLGEYDGDNAGEWEASKVICKDSADLHRGCHVVFGRIRLFLQNIQRGLDLLSRELQMEFPDLDLVMEEDNMYNKDITINDVVSIFKILKDNSIKKCEADVPTSLTINVSTKPRFVSRYNSLVEMLSGDATFANIQVFSNDQSHPVLLDDADQPENKKTEYIIMSSDDEKDGVQKEEDEQENSVPVANTPMQEDSATSVEPEPSSALKRKRDSVSDGRDALEEKFKSTDVEAT
ncbi:LAME_0H20934g1_1 [Lachancea meyersii CBS 8951]|uniref:LAME_0H20934g1_1 n=1 Tax=Lachancea meyersii CBS 8951 TaxID=1266667 RepID=A0A1G4KJQ7_9SACH|nr:LAME_0H20934g1_1 [Lachancea meyersii CBS 8951]